MHSGTPNIPYWIISRVHCERIRVSRGHIWESTGYSLERYAEANWGLLYEMSCL